MLNILSWIVLGLVSGAIAKAIYPGTQGGGFITTTVLGIIGAFLGGSLYSFLTTGALQLAGAGFSIPGFIIAIIGALIAIFLWGLVARRA
ncbi:MAG: GlsB/YeaQ/YmgE family stress response membrane protein [Drouetiella hepatica Uher 2000/2452]|jgi:uncharacterized membrane protein YeaQ/YmgE (transglycosylase-associated protein family)|uniref:GlsB/YeaQ/YmgE family stress response membrane protein n=1 Tax=Drouetiella hepatica Uher 2000/2452 TaxID=904376 RepID=A0A951QDT9_9CYAN|nr:GlsB/YeaQ/YmgE family stress response membrane protein [Drouetiella hepatica Uher 2000/2452]